MVSERGQQRGPRFFQTEFVTPSILTCASQCLHPISYGTYFPEHSWRTHSRTGGPSVKGKENGTRTREEAASPETRGQTEGSWLTRGDFAIHVHLHDPPGLLMRLLVWPSWRGLRVVFFHWFTIRSSVSSPSVLLWDGTLSLRPTPVVSCFSGISSFEDGHVTLGSVCARWQGMDPDLRSGRARLSLNSGWQGLIARFRSRLRISSSREDFRSHHHRHGFWVVLRLLFKRSGTAAPGRHGVSGSTPGPPPLRVQARQE